MALQAHGRRVGAGVLFLALWVASCDTANRPTAPDIDVGPSYAISDGAHDNGNPNFYFLPPIVKEAMASGTFDGSLSPRVEVCVLVEDEGDLECDRDEEPFWSSTGVTVDLLEEQYAVNWQTDGVGANQTYRIEVYSGTRLLGFTDVEFPENKGQAKKLGSDETILLNDGRTFPIKFRIEEFAELTSVGCEPDLVAILDCDVKVVAADDGEASARVEYENNLAAEVKLPDVPFDYFLTLELLPLSDRPSASIDEDNQFPYFARITAVDEQGIPVDFGDYGPEGSKGASLVLCQVDGAAMVPDHAWLRAFRVDDGVTTIWPKEKTYWAVEECEGRDEPTPIAMFDSHGHTTGHSLLDVLADAGKRRLASLFLPQPLRAMHGGLNPIGIGAFSTWGATVVEPPGGFEVSGTVYHSTTPLEDVKVTLHVESDLSIVQTTYSLADGTFAFTGVAPGDYTIRVHGPDATYHGWVGTSQTVVDSDLTELRMDLPKLITKVAPANGATDVALLPTLEWKNNVDAADTYTIQVNETTGWVLVEHTTGIGRQADGETSYTLVTDLTPGVNYTWMVDAYDSDGHYVGSTEQAFTFTTVPPTLPDLVVTGLTLDPTTLLPGDELTYTYTRANLGGPAPEYPENSVWDNQVYISTDEFLDESDITLPFAYSSSTYPVDEGFTVTDTHTNSIPDDLPAGSYYLIYLVDAGIDSAYPGVTESNEDNNWLAAPFTVVAAFLSGHVYVDGAPIAGIMLTATSLYGAMSVMTDAAGHYRFPIHSPATYTVSLAGISPPADFAVSSKEVTVAAGDDVTVDFSGALLYDSPLGTGPAATWTVAQPSTAVSLCNGEGTTTCASTSTTTLAAVATGPVTMTNPWGAGRVYFYSYRPGSPPHYTYLGWVAGSAAVMTTDVSTRSWTWTLTFDATGVPAGQIQLLAVGTTATLNYRTPVPNTNVTIVPGS